jgi:flagellar FliJ protein
MGETNAWENYILRLDQEAQRLTEKAAQAEIVVEEKRALYLEAQKELKVIEKIKEKKQKEYRKEMLDYEMNEIDDLTAARYAGN